MAQNPPRLTSPAIIRFIRVIRLPVPPARWREPGRAAALVQALVPFVFKSS
jgi:hypothetical protein